MFRRPHPQGSTSKVQVEDSYCAYNYKQLLFVYITNIMVCRRAWLDAVVMAMLNGPWKTQKAGASCLSRAVESSPQLATILLDSLEATMKKVSAASWDDDIVMMSHDSFSFTT